MWLQQARHINNPTLTITLELSQNVQEINRERLMVYSHFTNLHQVFSGVLHRDFKSNYPEIKKTFDSSQKKFIKHNAPEHVEDCFIHANLKEKMIVEMANLLEMFYESLVEYRRGNKRYAGNIQQLWEILTEKWIEISDYDLTLGRNIDSIMQWLEKEYDEEIQRTVNFEGD